jgi:hypothetical protein
VIFGSDAKRPFLVVGVVSGSLLYLFPVPWLRSDYNHTLMLYLTADDGTKLKHKVDVKLDRSTLCHDIGVTLKYGSLRKIIWSPQFIDFSAYYL